MTTEQYDDPVIPKFWNLPILRHLNKLQDMSNSSKGVPDYIKTQIQNCIDCINSREDYCDSTTSPSSTAIENMITKTNQHPWQQVYDRGDIQWKVGPGMLTGQMEGSFLKTLVSMANARRILEIGLFTGNSALAMAEALPVDGKVIALEISGYIGKFARQLMDESPHGEKVDIMIGPAKDNMEQLAQEGQKFDIVFIDANKEGYLDYYKIVMDNDMLTPRGTILIDNGLHGGMAYLSPEQSLLPGLEGSNMIITNFNEYVYNDDRVAQVMIPIRDGIMAIRRKDEFEGKL
ncbi:caffeoyl-CoA O-methyltransferase-like [Mizuhopecten yessoensis]|uniref:Caffeoyl-CoA O-methyltransferase n=1 Tax=Mizuhopecten yessoensis TaxID=6573 RepID=A0A210Q3Q7_MIZYE|nr:caffeoyl-CoA O-methyltransferase-like [Mizuhopecten yessoensis]OWF43376.1 Caffeoyl-CoA O-methyltransferase [Mizuhopecten yessoensis]